MNTSEIAITSLVAMALLIFFSLVWRGCENEVYTACLAKASEVSQCKELQP